ncbi:MAG: hypothetical protein COU69_04285 [Candidatus Pacebacteria bacterium CG10_big_fil_rev_8_21_14_0_10_56_10]|nr:MAG: hypothetical protein COU69_04285 [Candidatus Pacebacteria bacterium CG10_big_fil_rev_8_21_14_0_10_56_10]
MAPKKRSSPGKTRLTISLSNTTLRKVDQAIDGQQLRNRSHAIESLLERSLKPQISTAVILAGGPATAPIGDRGRSTGPSPASTPKPLTVLDDKPLIIYTLEHLKRHQVTKVIIATGATGHQLQDAVGGGERLGLSIEYEYEAEPLGTAGALRSLKKRLTDQPFFVLAGDVLTTIDLTELAEFHFQYRGLVTMAVKPRVTQASYDNVYIQGNRVIDFQASTADQSVGIINAGVYVFEPAALELIPDKTPAMLEKDFFPQVSKQHRLLGYPFQGIWFDIGSESNYRQALARLHRDRRDRKKRAAGKTVK